jgi:hypothetical protein
LASASGLHRNTITNIETGRYAGGPRTLDLEAVLGKADVEFIDESGGGPGSVPEENCVRETRKICTAVATRYHAMLNLRNEPNSAFSQVGRFAPVSHEPPNASGAARQIPFCPASPLKQTRNVQHPKSRRGINPRQGKIDDKRHRLFVEVPYVCEQCARGKQCWREQRAPLAHRGFVFLLKLGAAKIRAKRNSI